MHGGLGMIQVLRASLRPMVLSSRHEQLWKIWMTLTSMWIGLKAWQHETGLLSCCGPSRGLQNSLHELSVTCQNGLFSGVAAFESPTLSCTWGPSPQIPLPVPCLGWVDMCSLSKPSARQQVQEQLGLYETKKKKRKIRFLGFKFFFPKPLSKCWTSN